MATNFIFTKLGSIPEIECSELENNNHDLILSYVEALLKKANPRDYQLYPFHPDEVIGEASRTLRRDGYASTLSAARMWRNEREKGG